MARVHKLAILALVLAITSTSAMPESEAKSSAWSRARKPAKGSAESIGGYSAGCLRGAVAMPAQGPGFQTMRPSRKRVFGHPVLIEYLQRVANKINASHLGPLLIGDLGQPMGGPAPSGHSSHQSGLDVDVWLWHPAVAEKRRLRPKERESLQAKKVVDAKKKQVSAFWSDDIGELLRLAASEPEVSRIFVNPLIKQRLCQATDTDRDYLRKLRPWYGHDDHMHIRLSCPAESEECVNQDELPEGDGCSELDWWFDDEAQAARKLGKAKYQERVGALPTLPDSCNEMAAVVAK